MIKDDRVVCWFSCGATSAVAAKFAILHATKPVTVVYCNTLTSEHPDNIRFLGDISRWLGQEIQIISSLIYTDVDDVFERTRYMSGVSGARCTVEMKKVPRFNFQKPDDTHVFGYSADPKERKRMRHFEQTNPELKVWWVLAENNINKAQCFEILEAAGIKLPEMYALGFEHNNCLGCVKATSPGYWNRVRRLFPAIFERRAAQSRTLGVRLTRVNGVRIFLDELPSHAGVTEPDGDIECGPHCHAPTGV